MQSWRQYKDMERAVQAKLDREKTTQPTRVDGGVPSRQGLCDVEKASSAPDLVPSTETVERGADTRQEGTERKRRSSTSIVTGSTQYDGSRQDPGSPGQEAAGTAEVVVVGWDGPADPRDPRNWTVARRVGCTLEISLIAAAVGVGSGIDATVLPQAARALGVGEVAESLATGLYLVGQGVGALAAAPLSETFGRNAVYMGSLGVFMCWITGAALAPNLGAQLVFRFLAGCAASPPVVCSGGSVADMWDSVDKTWAFPLYAIAALAGPMLGPVMGAYVGPSPHVSWRWAEWTMLLLAAVVVVLVVATLPETYPPLLLRWKASHLRRLARDDRFRAAHELAGATLASRLRANMTRPFLMFAEPIIVAMTLYLSVVYVVLFTFLIGWPDIFEFTYGISQGLSNVLFVAIVIGLQFNFLLVPVVYRLTLRQVRASAARGHNHAHAHAHAPDHGLPFVPEIRLYYAMFGPAVAIPVSLFWMGWTASPTISIWSPILAAALFGFGVTGVFICAMMYVIDSYEIYSASALTFSALVRYAAAGGMTAAGIPFYHNMGVAHTLTILACISSVLAVVPYGLFKWGYLLRKRSKYAVYREL